MFYKINKKFKIATYFFSFYKKTGIIYFDFEFIYLAETQPKFFLLLPISIKIYLKQLDISVHL